MTQLDEMAAELDAIARERGIVWGPAERRVGEGARPRSTGGDTGHGSVPARPTEKLMSEAQRKLIALELSRRSVPAIARHELENALDEGVASQPVTMRQASRMIETLKSLPFVVRPEPPRAAKQDVLEAGIYLVAGRVVKVQRAVHGSGHMYAKMLDTDTGKFRYEAGLVSRVRPEQRMTLAQAREFGEIYGMCASCGATLTDEDSIGRGIGPVCAKKFA